MRWLWPRRQRGVWRSTTFRHVGTPLDPAPSPPPSVRELVSVIGVGQTVTAADLSITLLSYERYREADIANFWFVTERKPERFVFPELVFQVATTRDAVTRRPWGMGGSGGGGRDDHYSWRHSTAFVPPAADGAEVQIEISRIDWMSHSSGQANVASTTQGPWRFTVRT